MNNSKKFRVNYGVDAPGVVAHSQSEDLRAS